jgi:hypothetical protein
MQTSDIIALGALAVSIIALVYTIILNVRQRKYEKTQHELNEIQLEKEEKEKALENVANFNVQMHDNSNLNRDHANIVITNIGKGFAQNVKLELIDINGINLNKNLFPEKFMSGQSESIHYCFSSILHTGIVQLTWEDGQGSHSEEYNF